MGDDHCSCSLDELAQCNGLSCSNDVSSCSSCTRTLRSRQDIAIVDAQLVQHLVLDSTVQMMPGIVELVQYSVDDIGPMVATALPAQLHYTGCRVRVRTV